EDLALERGPRLGVCAPGVNGCGGGRHPLRVRLWCDGLLGVEPVRAYGQSPPNVQSRATAAATLYGRRRCAPSLTPASRLGTLDEEWSTGALFPTSTSPTSR